MCPVKDIPLDPLTAGATWSVATKQTKAIGTGGPGSPGPLLFRLGGLGTRILEHDKTNYVALTHEGALEFYLNGRLAGVLTAAGEFLLRGTAREEKTTQSIEQAAVLTASGGLEYDPNNGPAWSFGLHDGSKAIAVGRLEYGGDLVIYRMEENRFPLTVAGSPAFGSAYVLNVSGVTHISQNRTQTLARLDPLVLEKPSTQVAWDSGWKLPATASEQTGDALAGWNNDNNILLDNGSAATSQITSGFTNRMHALHYAFGAPTSLFAADGIKAKVSRSVNNVGPSLCKDMTIRLVVAGSDAGDNKADTVTLYPVNSVDAFVEYGGEDDLWGLTADDLTGSVLNASNFGFSFAAVTGGQICRLQNVQVRVYGHTFSPLRNARLNLRSVWERRVS